MTNRPQVPLEQRREEWRRLAEFWRGRSSKTCNQYQHLADGTLDATRRRHHLAKLGNCKGHPGYSRLTKKVVKP